MVFIRYGMENRSSSLARPANTNGDASIKRR